LLLPRALKTQSTITMGVLGLLRAQALSNTNQSPQKWKQFKRKAFGVIDGVRYTTGQAQAISNCVGLGLSNGLGGQKALWWPDLRTNQTATILAIMVRF
jgi:hypothetical protein